MPKKQYYKTQTTSNPKFPKTPIKKITQYLMRFSFKYLDLTHELFTFEAVCQQYGNDYYKDYKQALLKRLASISTWKVNDFRQSNSRALRAHPINWLSDTVQLTGLGILNNSEPDECAYQFNISLSKYGRIIGFMIDNTFFIRWLDPGHQCDIGRHGKRR
ncbi:MAG: hypothetical protein FVQ82_02590 [Planctomycetes bacterium]|nr:hypothetical protein [Planctomycetota bacterium]